MAAIKDAHLLAKSHLHPPRMTRLRSELIPESCGGA